MSKNNLSALKIVLIISILLGLFSFGMVFYLLSEAHDLKHIVLMYSSTQRVDSPHK